MEKKILFPQIGGYGSFDPGIDPLCIPAEIFRGRYCKFWY